MRAIFRVDVGTTPTFVGLYEDDIRSIVRALAPGTYRPVRVDDAGNDFTITTADRADDVWRKDADAYRVAQGLPPLTDDEAALFARRVRNLLTP